MNREPIARRTFLQQSAAAATLATTSGSLAWGQETTATTKTAAEFIPGKDARLLAYNTKVGEIETPLQLLREHRLTPKEILFIRNNQVLPNALSLEPAPLAGWQLEFGGLVDTPRKLTGEELAKLPQVEWEMVIQCSGNGRSWFARTVKADGVQWKNGAMGNVKFKGVKLATVVEHLGLKIKPEARFVAVEGADAPEKPGAADFEHSLPLAESLEKSLLVLGMNGEPLPRAHGGPVRLVTAGYYATMHVKWAHKLRFEAEESTNMYHLTRYRTPLKPLQPGEKFTSTLTNSEPNWGMKVKSVIFAPLVGEKIPAGETTLSGVAWNDGAAAIATVEVTTDGGRTWRRAELENSTGPYAWRHWSLRATFPAGEHKVHVRAIDALGRTQPWDGSIHWTPSGYVWNGVDEVAFVAG